MAKGTSLGKAYVQIMPSAQGIKGKIQKIIDPETETAGKSGGRKFGIMFAKTAAAAGIGIAIKKSIEEGAKLEQSIGGIETLFKGSADIVKKQADEAFKTVGVSANEYMENVTGFSASLLQSVAGDTAIAAKISNRAMIDMADNSNKMGSSMESIQNAYQGFAKQNYTMLDNLKLGYGGTKKEMQRLLKDATKFSGIKYNIDNLADVYTAIGVVQEQLGITGTTALEAEETISGSLNAMKSSFTNILGKLALGDDIGPSLEALSSTMSTFIFNNLLPMIGNILSALPGGLIAFFKDAGPMFLKQGYSMISSLANGFIDGYPDMLDSALNMLDTVADYLTKNVPVFITKGFEMLSKLVQGITNAMPVLIAKLPEIITKFAKIINDNFPTILLKGTQLLIQFVTGILKAIPTLVMNLPKIIEAIYHTILAFNWLNLGGNIMKFFSDGIKSMVALVKSRGGDIFKSVWGSLSNLPQTLWNLAKSMISKFGNAITNSTGTIKGAIKGIFNAIWNGLANLPSQMAGIGKNIVQGLWRGITSVKDWILGKIGGFVDSVMGGIKKFFGIKSPSREMADQVGKYLPSGIALGIETNTKPLLDTMDDLSALTVSSFDADLAVNGRNTITTSEVSEDKLSKAIMLLEVLISKLDRSNDEDDFVNSIVRAFLEIVTDMGVYLNEREVGKIVSRIIKEKGLA